MGSTDKRAPQGFAPIAIGLGLTLIHLISIPVTNTSVNPARSTSQAVFVGGGLFRSCGFSGLRRFWELFSQAFPTVACSARTDPEQKCRRGTWPRISNGLPLGRRQGGMVEQPFLQSYRRRDQSC
jgi:hypothetical protein